MRAVKVVMKKVSFSPSKTPVKVYNPRPNDSCRVCRESIRISGRSQINLFGDKNQDFLRRFRGVVGTKIENIAGVIQDKIIVSDELAEQVYLPFWNNVSFICDDSKDIFQINFTL